MLRLTPKTYTGLPRASVEFSVKIIASQVFVVLYDLDEPNARSLTHDLEYVMTDLKAILPGICSAVVIYRDTEGLFDLVECMMYGSVGITTIAALSEEEAIEIWAKRTNTTLPKQFVF